MRKPKDPTAQLGNRFFIRKIVMLRGHVIKMIPCVLVNLVYGKPWVAAHDLSNQPFPLLWSDLIPADEVKCTNCPHHCRHA